MDVSKYIDIVKEAYTGYFNYLWREISFQYDYKPIWENYFYYLLLISAFFFALEIIRPWRENQARFRKDFWLDFFYMFFNFFLFSLVFYNAASNVMVELFSDFLRLFGIENVVAIHIESWPRAAQLLLLFVLSDFIQWNVHRLLHRVPFLWEFHKVHHSVEQMGFAAHLRYHWMENLVYKSIQYLPLAMIGFGIDDFFIVYAFNIAVGHFNHANFKLNLGPLKYIFNNPEMHIWHHARDLPEGHPYGINYGLTLSIWDYLFGTAVIPAEGKDIPLGFPGLKEFPTSFWGQFMYGLAKKKEKNTED